MSWNNAISLDTLIHYSDWVKDHIFFTSDHHFGHYNIIKYCNRPWPNTFEMDKALIKLWNETVEPGDEVFYLGDFAMNKIWVEKIVPQLNGRKHLIPGNHDKCFSMTDKWLDFFRNAGFGTIALSAMHFIAGQEVMISHMPYRKEDDKDQRYQEKKLPDEGKWLLHGHVHDRWKHKGKMINVGVDVWDYKPVSFRTIETLIKENPDGFPYVNLF